ncbi:MAG TPA: NYN domain-containing protein [Candidatus Limiplasma sp.]|mgnify:CR=1 FL=1|nr:NYN domain-containing protein [Candidatus Limiplasma sp.]
MNPILFVDGYNVIGAWPQMQHSPLTVDEARDRLIDLLEDYAGSTAQEVILVFDGYQGERATASVERRHTLTVIFTKHGQTADQYIEHACGKLPAYREVRVATSDHLEQTMILGRGATRLSSRELWHELNAVRRSVRSKHVTRAKPASNPLLGGLSDEQRETLEQIRRQK